MRRAKVQRKLQVGRETDAVPKSTTFHPDSKLQVQCACRMASDKLPIPGPYKGKY